MALVTGQKLEIENEAVALGPSALAVDGVDIKALVDNDDLVWVGGPDVNAGTGVFIDAGESVFVKSVHGNLANPAEIYLFASTGSQGVCYIVR